VIISEEDMPAYDRTLLSKALPTGDASKWQFRSADFLKNADIEYHLGKKATKVDTKSQTITL
jgi:NAD(P)H-nitrite reductase large subunit